MSHTQIISPFAADQRHRKQSIRLTKELQTAKPDQQSDRRSRPSCHQTPHLDRYTCPTEQARPDDSAIVTDIITVAIKVAWPDVEREPIHGSILGEKCARIEPVATHSELTKVAVAGCERIGAYSSRYSPTHQRKD